MYGVHAAGLRGAQEKTEQGGGRFLYEKSGLTPLILPQ